jgi:mannose-6-phosphate isomerase-like protein (cupin superfamily)
MEDFSKVVVKKPWGFEYLVYSDDNMGIWYLHINHEESTSMHCHPNKKTGLILLRGVAELSFLNESRFLTVPAKITIREGVFHSTKALSDNGIGLFEVECPNNKVDLVRLRDKYGRRKSTYETDYITRDDSHLLISNDNTRFFENHKISIIRDSTIKIKDYASIVVIKGGLKNIDNVFVASCGDVLSGKTWNLLAKEFNYDEPLELMVVEPTV